MNGKTDLKNLNQHQLEQFALSLGQPAFRGRQLLAWIYRPGIRDFSEMTDLAKVFREVLRNNAYLSKFVDPIVECSSDGSVKFGFRL